MLKFPQQSQLLKPPISHAPTPKSSLTPRSIKLEEQSTFQRAELRLKYQNQFKKQTQNMDLMRAIKEMKDHLEQEESQTKSSPKAYHTIVQETVDQIYQESSEEFKENIQLLDKHLKRKVSQLELWQVQRKQNLNQQSQSVLDLQLDLTIKNRDLKQVDNYRNRNNHTTLQHQSTSLNSKNSITVEPLNGVGNQQKTLITNDSKLQLINMNFIEDKKQHQNPLVLPNFSNSYQISPDQSQNQLKHLSKNSHQTIDVNQLNKSVMRQEKQSNKNNYHLKSLSVDNSLTQFNFHQVSQNISISVNSPQNTNLNARQTQFLFNSQINIAKNTNDLDQISTKEDSKITNFPQIVNKQTNINFKFNDSSRQPQFNQAYQNKYIISNSGIIDIQLDQAIISSKQIYQDIDSIFQNY